MFEILILNAGSYIKFPKEKTFLLLYLQKMFLAWKKKTNAATTSKK